MNEREFENYSPLKVRGHRFKCFVFDLDGTLCNLDHRLPMLKQSPVDWDAFTMAAADDLPIPHMMKIMQYIAIHNNVICISGRADNGRDLTWKWLDDNVGSGLEMPMALYMRKQGDARSDTVVKAELLEQARADGWDPVAAFEDRAACVKWWRSVGIPCLQVAEGDF